MAERASGGLSQRGSEKLQRVDQYHCGGPVGNHRSEDSSLPQTRETEALSFLMALGSLRKTVLR